MRSIFIGPNGIRAGWRLLIFLAIIVVEVLVAGTIVALAFPHWAAEMRTHRPKSLLPISSGGFEGFALLVGVVAAYVMSKIENRPFRAYGLPWREAFRARFWRGAFWGFAAISAVLLTIFAMHGFRVTGFAIHGLDIVTAFALWALAFVLVGLSEEFTFRGYSQFTLTTGLGFWPAAILLSCGFAAAHVGNPGETPIGISEVALFGLVFCFVLQRTGNLWWGVGFHASWDWGETFFYGVRDSGFLPWHPLLATSFSGPVWLTGGSAGPEGSIVTGIVLILTALLVARMYPRATYSTQTIPEREPGASVGARSIAG